MNNKEYFDRFTLGATKKELFVMIWWIIFNKPKFHRLRKLCEEGMSFPFAFKRVKKDSRV